MIALCIDRRKFSSGSYAGFLRALQGLHQGYRGWGKRAESRCG